MENLYHNILMATFILLDFYVWAAGSVFSSLIAFILGMMLFLSYVSKYLKIN